MDREKVIRALEAAVKNFERYSGDEYGREYDYARVEVETLEDAIALLKAQEPEALDIPKPDSEIGCWYDITHNYTLEQVVSALKAQEPVELMNNKNDCPICGMKYNEPSISSSFAPSMCWLETTLKINGVIQMKFGYGDDFEHIFYYPKYCPECGRKVKWK